MSRHTLKTKSASGHEVEVMLGFDRPLQGFWCNVESTDVDDDDDDNDDSEEESNAPFYSNLGDVDLIGNPNPPELDHFLVKIKELGIEVPQAMIDSVLEDQAHNVGNRIVQWTAKGVPTETDVAQRPRGG